MAKILTGITTTGTPHLGNYIGAIKPAITMSQANSNQCYLFLADLHALIKARDAKKIHQSTLEIAATWLACGLNANRVIFYRQSDVVEITQLTWVLNCVAAKGLLNRAHAYKDAVEMNKQQAQDTDSGVTMGLFSYPVLMAADILLFAANRVPVGQDQIQHLEITRDIALRFNHHYGEILTIPEFVVDKHTPLIKGIDGRKMSKSYNNIIPLFATEKQLLKSIKKIVTNSQLPGEPKSLIDNNLYNLYQCFATKEQTKQYADDLQRGLGWGDAKIALFELINDQIAVYREKYQYYTQNPKIVETILLDGAQKARQQAQPLMQRVLKAVGIQALG